MSFVVLLAWQVNSMNYFSVAGLCPLWCHHKGHNPATEKKFIEFTCHASNTTKDIILQQKKNS
jgi:hypothetical protein